MPSMYCTKCCINWANVETQDDEFRDESFECCPVCKSDMYLKDSIPGPRYLLHNFSGDIVNVETFERLTRPVAPPPNTKSKYYFNREAYEEAKNKREKLQDMALDAYQRVYAVSGKIAAEKAYWQTINSQKQ